MVLEQVATVTAMLIVQLVELHKLVERPLVGCTAECESREAMGADDLDAETLKRLKREA